MSAPKPAAALLKEVAGGPPALKHQSPPAEPVSQVAAKVLIGVQGKQRLSHVEQPKDGLTEAQKAAFLEDRKAEKEAAAKK